MTNKTTQELRHEEIRQSAVRSMWHTLAKIHTITDQIDIAETDFTPPQGAAETLFYPYIGALSLHVYFKSLEAAIIFSLATYNEVENRDAMVQAAFDVLPADKSGGFLKSNRAAC